MNRPTHFEILADDPVKVADFYTRVLDWEVTPWNEGDSPYLLVKTGAAEHAGINGGIMQRILPQAVINTIEVDSLDSSLKRVESAGGKMVHGPSGVPGIGLHAYCADPEGNLFGLLQPADPTG